MYNKVLALLQEEYPEVDFPYDEIIEENFNSVEAMAEMVERLQA